MEAGCFQVGFDLGMMDIFQGFDGFQLHNDLVADDKIQPVQTNFFVLENDPDLFLLFVGDCAVSQGNFHRFLIHTFQKPRPQSLMHLHRRLQNSP